MGRCRIVELVGKQRNCRMDRSVQSRVLSASFCLHAPRLSEVLILQCWITRRLSRSWTSNCAFRDISADRDQYGPRDDAARKRPPTSATLIQKSTRSALWFRFEAHRTLYFTHDASLSYVPQNASRLATGSPDRVLIHSRHSWIRIFE